MSVHGEFPPIDRIAVGDVELVAVRAGKDAARERLAGPRFRQHAAQPASGVEHLHSESRRSIPASPPRISAKLPMWLITRPNCSGRSQAAENAQIPPDDWPQIARCFGSADTFKPASAAGTYTDHSRRVPGKIVLDSNTPCTNLPRGSPAAVAAGWQPST